VFLTAVVIPNATPIQYGTGETQTPARMIKNKERKCAQKLAVKDFQLFRT
jgi:hypothetical protein